ncbi:MAG: hypothetical protein ABIC19_00635 [Patescibacteria group bacterium]|nr:hypothetical protein [Patescibacteria group bacterium]
MNPVNLNAYINLSCGTDDDEFPQADKLILLNIYKDDIAKEIVKRNEDYFGMVFTRNLVADQREYGLPENILNNLKFTEAKIDGTNWKRLDEFDLNQYKRPTNEDEITSQFAGKNPGFDIFRNSLWIYSEESIIDVSGGLKLWAITYPADIEDLTSTIDMSIDPVDGEGNIYSSGFPRQFHELLGRRVTIHWKGSQDRPVSLNEKELSYEMDLEKALDAITGMNLDRSVVGSVTKDDGQDY